jgi:hypothetical protein
MGGQMGDPLGLGKGRGTEAVVGSRTATLVGLGAGGAVVFYATIKLNETVGNDALSGKI